MNRLLSFVIALVAVLCNITIVEAYQISSASDPLCDCIIASNNRPQLLKRELRPYASFPEVWPSRSAKYENEAILRRRLEESKWAKDVFDEVSKRFRLYKTKYGIQQTKVSCRVLYRVKSDKTIEVAFTKKSGDNTFDSFLNGILKSLNGASILTFPTYLEEIEKAEKSKCLAVSFEYNISLNSRGEIEIGPIQICRYGPVKSNTTISKLNKPRKVFLIDDRRGSYDSISVRYYFKKEGV